MDGPLGSVIRLRFKSARLETRDARPVVSDNGLLFFRGQMLDQNCRQRREPSATPARGDRQPRELKVSEGGRTRQTRVSSPLHKSPAYLSACVFQPRLLSAFLRDTARNVFSYIALFFGICKRLPLSFCLSLEIVSKFLERKRMSIKLKL